MEQQEQWEEMLPILEYALNDSYCKATLTTPFRLLRGYDPVGPQHFMFGADQELGAVPRGSWERRWIDSQEKVWEFVKARQKEITARMKERYDHNRKPLDLDPGDLVLLSTKSHQLLEGYRKQQERFVGPYVVQKKVHPNAYKLAGLPPGVPPTQNVRFLLKHNTSPDRFSSRPDPDASTPQLIDGEYEWEVEDVVGHKDTRHGMKYLVKWKGFTRKQWLHEGQMEHAKQTLLDYRQRLALPLTFFLLDDSDIESEDAVTPPAKHSPPLKERSSLSASDSTPPCTNAPRTDNTPSQRPQPPTTLLSPHPRRSPRFIDAPAQSY